MKISLFSWLFFVPICSIFLNLGIFVVSQNCLIDQQDLLLRLKNSLIFNSSLSKKVVHWDVSSNCCSWEGVTCSNGINEGRVIGLNLTKESIAGGLVDSSTLFSLQHLRNLSLAFNHLGNSTIPAGFGNLTNLSYLNLSNAGFSGQIPLEISNLKRLVTLDLSISSLWSVSMLKIENPDLAMIVRNFSELKELYLDGVNISASGNNWCEALLSSLGNLTVLSMSNCYLSTATKSNNTATKSNNNRIKIMPIVGGGISGIIVLMILGFLILRRAKTTWHWRGPFSFHTSNSTETHGSTLPYLCRYFSLAEIKAATKNFDQNSIIGVGGFGDVYKGYIHIDGEATHVAIKRLKPGSQQGVQEFKTEIEILSQLRHHHLVSLIGYCNDGNEMILVYDFMPGGTLCSHLYNTDKTPLPWNQRLQICIGAARALNYLHIGAKRPIIHRDVKTTNILLDEKWTAKVSDFGLSKFGPTSTSKAHVSTAVKGSFGYLDPEYYRRRQLTEKSDVYSFGVVLLEVLCARPPIMHTVEHEEISLAEWGPKCYRNGQLDQIVDPLLKAEIEPECLKKFGEIAVNCLHDNGTERPSMNDVVWGLELALQLQGSAEKAIFHGEQSFARKEYQDGLMSIFSEIMNPDGR